MSKTFDEQVKILQNNCDMSFDDAREAMIVYNAYSEDEDGHFIITSDFAKVIEFFKKKRHFDVLQRISVAEKPEKFELVYTLYSTKENKTIDFSKTCQDKTINQIKNESFAESLIGNILDSLDDNAQQSIYY